MWKKLLDTEYFMRCTDNFEIYVTDYVSIWVLQSSEKNFLICLKCSNAGLEMNDKDFILKGKHMLSHPEGLKKVDVQVDGSVLAVTMTMSFGFPFKLNMELQEGSKEIFFQMLTSQLLQTIHDLRSSEQELRQILLKKDKELAEYKDEKGQIVFRSLKTEPYNDEAHMTTHTSYHENFGTDDIPYCLLKKIFLIPQTESSELKQETADTKNGVTLITLKPDNVKLEPSTIKCETQSITSETQTIKYETQNVQSETHSSESSVKIETLSDSRHRIASSRSKRQKRKLNL